MAYNPPAASRFSCCPLSTIRPPSTTRIALARRMVEKRWAITNRAAPFPSSYGGFPCIGLLSLYPCLLAQALLVHWAVVERPPLSPELSSFPATLGRWRMQSENTIAAGAFRGQLQARDAFAEPRIWARKSSRSIYWSRWFTNSTDREGNRQPHSLPLSLFAQRRCGTAGCGSPSGVRNSRWRPSRLLRYALPRKAT